MVTDRTAPRTSSNVQENSANEPKPSPNLLANFWDNQRQQMVEQQINRRGIKSSALLAALSKVPRHLFVPPDWSELAYQDGPLPIGHHQTISQPYIVAAMTEAAEIYPQDRVLEIGTGSGYQTAVLAELAQFVYTVEIVPELAKRAFDILTELGYTNVHGKTDNGYLGWAEYAPYDVIVVTAAPPNIPPPLKKQLAFNGRMVIPVGNRNQELLSLKKTEQGWIEKSLFPVRFVPLIY